MEMSGEPEEAQVHAYIYLRESTRIWKEPRNIRETAHLANSKYRNK